MHNADELIWLMREEIVQRGQEGCRVRGFDRKLKAAGRDTRRLSSLYDQLMALKPDPVLARAEPSGWEAIQKLRPRQRIRLKSPKSPRELRDRLHGAMLGRSAACMLGKPVEGWLADRIIKALTRDGRYPLNDYFAESTIIKGGKPVPVFGTAYCTRGHFDHMLRDDDIDFTILGIHYVKTYGKDFTTQDVGNELLHRVPYYLVFTAERVAYKNLVANLPLDRVPTYRNPFREWIGGQIRADGLAYCAAGVPETAAAWAYRDACLTHVRNGIYGELLFAGMISAAFVLDDLEEIIDVGLAMIPPKSRLAEAVRDTVAWSHENKDWRGTLDAIIRKYGHYCGVHIINNAALVIMGLLHGKGDYSKTITITCMGGWDTDCTAATAGSIVGAMIGAKQLPARWIAPLNNKVRSFIIGYEGGIPITDIADMALDINRKLRSGKGLGRPKYRTILPY